MMNTSLFEKMVNRYNELSYTHNYIYGFYFQNNVYMVEATAEVMPYILKLDKASRGGGLQLEILPNQCTENFSTDKRRTGSLLQKVF